MNLSSEVKTDFSERPQYQQGNHVLSSVISKFLVTPSCVRSPSKAIRQQSSFAINYLVV